MNNFRKVLAGIDIFLKTEHFWLDKRTARLKNKQTNTVWLSKIKVIF